VPSASACLLDSSTLVSMTTKSRPAARPKPQIRMWSLSASISFNSLLSSSSPKRCPATKNSVTVTSA
jgi:hypothetical protein